MFGFSVGGGGWDGEGELVGEVRVVVVGGAVAVGVVDGDTDGEVVGFEVTVR